MGWDSEAGAVFAGIELVAGFDTQLEASKCGRRVRRTGSRGNSRGGARLPVE
jgi:hypothetical protein